MLQYLTIKMHELFSFGPGPINIQSSEGVSSENIQNTHFFRIVFRKRLTKCPKPKSRSVVA